MLGKHLEKQRMNRNVTLRRERGPGLPESGAAGDKDMPSPARRVHSTPQGRVARKSQREGTGETKVVSAMLLCQPLEEGAQKEPSW